jgi:AcrR family transcriptional regulator
MPSPEDQTRARLIEAAGQVFAEQGFQAAKIRDICARAGANIAAVNYHFRDKMGLYVAVLENSICAGRPADARALLEGGIEPEEALRRMIAYMLERMCRAGGPGAWHVRIMVHEIAQPSAALDRVIDEVIAPNNAVMRQILSRLLGTPPDHETTRLCAHSIVGQVVHYAHARPVIARLWPEFELNQERLTRIAAHIADFSLLAVRGLATRAQRTTE